MPWKILVGMLVLAGMLLVGFVGAVHLNVFGNDLASELTPIKIIANIVLAAIFAWFQAFITVAVIGSLTEKRRLHRERRAMCLIAGSTTQKLRKLCINLEAAIDSVRSHSDKKDGSEQKTLENIKKYTERIKAQDFSYIFTTAMIEVEDHNRDILKEIISVWEEVQGKAVDVQSLCSGHSTKLKQELKNLVDELGKLLQQLEAIDCPQNGDP